MSLAEIRIRADQALHIGIGRGSDFSQETLRYVPSSTLRGALGAAWLRADSSRRVDELLPLLDLLRFSDAVPTPPSAAWTATVVPLDRATCKYPEEGQCPATHPWHVDLCPGCGRPPEPSKGMRGLPSGASIEFVTRVALDQAERAKDDALYEREMLLLGENELVGLVDGDPSALVQVGDALRLGAAKSVAGRATVTAVGSPTDGDARLALDPGHHDLRVEMLTPGVFVDDFGFPSTAPTPDQLRSALSLADNTKVGITESFTRWGRAAGWNVAANVPKTEDHAVIAHSVYLVSVHVSRPHRLHSVASGLGLRVDEGCGWFAVRAGAKHA